MVVRGASTTTHIGQVRVAAHAATALDNAGTVSVRTASTRAHAEVRATAATAARPRTSRLKLSGYELPRWLAGGIVACTMVFGCGTSPSTGPLGSADRIASPATNAPESPFPSPDWAALSSRSPHLETGAGACPLTELVIAISGMAPALDADPVFAVIGRNRWSLGELPRTAGTGRLKIAWAASSAYKGPVLLRLYRLGGSEPTPVRISAPIGQASATELRLDEATMSDPSLPEGWRLWGSGAEIAQAGCYVWQIEGADFGRVAYFEILN